MFKNLCVYRLGSQPLPAYAELEAALVAQAFVACGATQAQSSGWVPPRGQTHGPLLESVQGQWILRLQSEQRLLPSSVVQERCQEIAEQIESQTGRRPGKRQTKEIKEQALLELLPMAFTRTRSTWVWIAARERLLVVDAGSQGRADEVITLLGKSVQGVSMTLLHTQLSPAQAMSTWLLSGDAPAGFSVDRECELRAPDENRAVVRYARHALDTPDVQQHIRAGKLPTRLAMSWRDRVSFVLTESLALKKFAFLDGVMTEAATAAPAGASTRAGDEESWDADVALTTGELVGLLADLIAALGGETELGAAEPGLGDRLSAEAACAASPAPAAPPMDHHPEADHAPPWDV